MVLSRYKYTAAKGVHKIRTKTAIVLSTVGLLVGSGGGISLAILGTAHADAPTNVYGCSFVETTGEWSLQSDCNSTQRIPVPANTTLEGNGHTISPIFSKTSNSNNATLEIAGDNTTVNDLVIDGTNGTNLHGVNTYMASNVVLNNVTVKNNDHDGIVVNGSDVTVNNLTTMNNGWGGVDVDQGSGVTSPSKLTVNGTSKQSEAGGLDIYVDNIAKSVSVVDTNSQYVVKHNVNQIGDAAYTLLNVSVASPSANAVIGSTAHFTGTVNADGTDGLRGNGIRLSFRPIDNGVVQSPVKTFNVPVDISSTNQWMYNVDTSQLSDGPYLVVARANDNSGSSYATSRTAAATVHVTVDNTAPVVSINDPTNGSHVHGMVNILGSISDANPDHYYLQIKRNSDNHVVYSHVYYGAPQTFNDHSIYTWNTSEQPNGSYTVLLAARDAAGNRNANSEDSVTVVVNNAPTSKDQCKEDGWNNFVSPEFNFRNQGACVSYVNHHDGIGQDDVHAYVNGRHEHNR